MDLLEPQFIKFVYNIEYSNDKKYHDFACHRSCYL